MTAAYPSGQTRIAKYLLIMKLTFLLIIWAMFQGVAGTNGQTITLKKSRITYGQLFREIQLQTGYDVLLRTSNFNLEKTTRADFDKSTLQDVLKVIKGTENIDYTLDGKSIILHPVIALPIKEASQQSVRGRVIDKIGKPIAGVSISVKDKSVQATTDRGGEFELNNVTGADVLIISMLGFNKQVVGIHDRTTVNIVLEESTTEIIEVQVVNTGYQRIKKDQLTGAASVVDEKTYHQREAVTGNFLESLEGKVPGLVYNGQTGELSIRGVSTFDAVKQPLIVLDGFPTEIDLRTINPNDIISVSVLRDAAAASIYGVRASNGVIIVETRRGKSGRTQFNFRSSIAFQEKPDFDYLQYLPAADYVQLQKQHFHIAKPSAFRYDLGFAKKNPAEEILFSGPHPEATNPVLTEVEVDEQLLALGSYDNLHDYERLFYRNRQVKNLSLDASGGNDISTYFLGFNYIGESPVNRGAKNDQFNLNMANTIKFSPRFNFDFRGTYTNIDNKTATTPSYNDFFPYERLVDNDGNALPVALGPGRNYSTTFMNPEVNSSLQELGLYDMLYYPYREWEGNSTRTRTSSVRFQGRLNSKITDWLSMDLGGNYESQQSQINRLQTDGVLEVRRLLNTSAVKDPVTGRAVFSNMPAGDILRRTQQKLVNYTLRGQLNFNKNFDETKHSVSGILGVEQKKTQSEGYMTSFFAYDGQSLIVRPVNAVTLNATAQPAFPFTAQGYGGPILRFSSPNFFNETFADRRFMSYYGQGTYIYDDKYVATGSFRIDQSNLFGVDPKYRNKPLWSAGLNWRIGQEDFIKKYDWVSQLQLRVATGFNGNVPTSNNGSFLILNSALNTNFQTPLTYNEVLSPENQSLRWETTKNYNIGLDYSLFGGRVSGAADYYIKRSKDVFGLFDADPTTGFNQYNANTASIENRGLELLINTVNIKRSRFAWQTGLTASFNTNKILAVKATDFNSTLQYVNSTNPVQGKPLGSLYSYNYGGLNALGQPFVLDNDGNQNILNFFTFGTGIIDVTREDLIYSGTTTPKYVLGLNNQFSVGAFDLSFLFMYYGGHVMRVEQPMPNNITGSATSLRGANDFWRKPGDEVNTRVPGFLLSSSTMTGYYGSSALNGYTYAHEFVRKADYIRLRDLIVTYNARSPFLEKAGLKNTQLRFQAQNPWRYTFSGNDIDPDAIDRLSGIRRLETQPFYSFTLLTNF